MTAESREELFGRYWAAKQAGAAYGLSSDFEEDPSFATDPELSPYWTENPLTEQARNTFPELPSRNFPPFVNVAAGSGKTYFLAMHSIILANPVVILPSALITSEAGPTSVTSGLSEGTATQHSTTPENDRVEELIWRIGTAPSIRYRQRLAARLTELQKTVQEEEPDGRGITVRSLQHFFDFLKVYPDLRCPAISATPERNIYASWKSGSNRVFSVHFLPDGNVRFVIFCPNDKHKEEMIRISGTATADTIISIATPHGVLNWASDERPDNP